MGVVFYNAHFLIFNIFIIEDFIMDILREWIKKILIQEFADRSGDPHQNIVSWQEESDYNIDIYPAGEGWDVEIKGDDGNPGLTKSFPDPEEAQLWARNHMEKLRRIKNSKML